MDFEKLSHYEIVAKIGVGGMGEVYRARDARLGREVALKLLPAAVSADLERLARFEREARLLASLNHPNIAAIHNIDQSGNQKFLVLELALGEDLSDRISRGPVSPDEALPIALQISQALETAHEAGIVHRDLKPGNIKIDPTGKVKVLDFGLAKALTSDPSEPDISKSPTLVAGGTIQGVILGTAAYMSPEQARGKQTDRRTDVFAFGCVVFEMLAGKQAFPGETISDTLAAVLRSEPEWNALPAETPPQVLRLLRRCLEKEPRRRLRDIGEARIVIEDVVAGRTEELEFLPRPTAAGRTRISRRAVYWIFPAAAVVIAGAFVVATRSKPSAPASALRKYTLMLDTEKGELPHEVALSPDGSRIAYLDGGKLWVRDLDDPDSRMVVDAAITEMRPFWSPDSDWLGFADGKQLKKVSVQGGVATPVCNTKSSFSTGGAGGAWSRDGRIVFSQGSSGLYEVPASGGDPKLLHDIEPMVESDFHQPQFLPGDKDLIFVQHRLRHGPDTILLLRDGKRSTVLRVEGSNLSKPCYAPSGHILYHRFGEGLGLWAVPFSLDSGKTTGDPLLVSSEGSGPSVGTDGSLLYTRGDVSSYGQLVWVDRSGNVVESLSEPLGLIQSLALSPDGGRAAVSINEAGNRDIWLMDLGRGTKTRLTFSKAYENQGTWFPDGSAIAFTDTDEWKILLRTIDGTGPPIPLVKGRSPEFSRDGRFLVYQLEESQNRGDIWAKELRADSQTVAIVQTQADETDPALSPDGRLLAYRSDESGSDEIYLTRFPSADGKWQVSSRGGYSPRWNGSGSRIYYLEDQSLMEVAVELKGGVTLGSPRKVFDLGPAELQYWGWKTYGVAADDRRFFFAKRTRIQGQKTSIVLVQDWHSEFSAPK